jgi:N-acetylglucosaminyl-diphospho-decaprenol L-rhamnosyltransferase
MTAGPLGIVIVNYGSSSMLLECVGGRAWAIAPRIIIVDNFSSDIERTSVRAVCEAEGWDLVERPNVGFGTGMNAGVARARELGCDTVLLLNPDTVVTAAAIESLATAARTEPLSIHAPVILRQDGSVWFSGGSLDLRTGATSTRPGTDSSAPGGWLTGACLAMSVSLWDRVGGFDDRYFLYWEDIDLSFRCVEVGGSLVVHGDIHIIHSVGATQAGDGKSAVYVYYNCRNRLLFARTHLSPSATFRWVLGAPKYALRVVTRSGRRHFLAHLGGLSSAALRGTLRGGLG